MLNQVIRCVDEANGTTTLTNSSTTLSSQFTDADQVDSWAVESMAKLNNNGLMSGSGNTLSPKNNTSVQEAITLIQPREPGECVLFRTDYGELARVLELGM